MLMILFTPGMDRVVHDAASFLRQKLVVVHHYIGWTTLEFDKNYIQSFNHSPVEQKHMSNEREWERERERERWYFQRKYTHLLPVNHFGGVEYQGVGPQKSK